MRKIVGIIVLASLIPACLFTQSWHKVGYGVLPGGDVQVFKIINNELYIGGAFYKAPDGSRAIDIVKWDGGTIWTGLGDSDIISDIYSIEMYKGKLFVGGQHPTINLETLNGNQWDFTLTANSGVLAMKYKNDLYLGGTFDKIGTLNMFPNWCCIARYDGTNFNAMQGGLNNQSLPLVLSMVVYNGDLIVSGEFNNAGGKSCNNIARWDGTQWQCMGNGIRGYNGVFAMTVDTINNWLYAAGGFDSAGTVPAKNVARWDGTNWSAVGTPLQGFGALVMYKGELYGGGGGITNTSADTIMSKWDGTQWTRIQGPNQGVNALVVYKGNLYAGGYFDKINDTMVVNYFACYGDSCPQNVGVHELQQQEVKFKVYPNPAKNNIIVEVEEWKGGGMEEEYTVRITSPLGQKVAEKKFTKRTEVEVSGFGKGLFLVEVCETPDIPLIPPSKRGTEVRCHTEKVVIQ
ncbi:MAG: T9SS type A sorting domain-containing protein [Bacteroidetes bacterium]|nr:T9SS type A sorting domain-containing protein [Bacteroidota bacterium]